MGTGHCPPDLVRHLLDPLPIVEISNRVAPPTKDSLGVWNIEHAL